MAKKGRAAQLPFSLKYWKAIAVMSSKELTWDVESTISEIRFVSLITSASLIIFLSTMINYQ